jgi:hypothetical protein
MFTRIAVSIFILKNRMGGFLIRLLEDPDGSTDYFRTVITGSILGIRAAYSDFSFI